MGTIAWSYVLRVILVISRVTDVSRVTVDQQCDIIAK